MLTAKRIRLALLLLAGAVAALACTAPVSVSIAPGSAALALNSTQQFVATVTGNPLSTVAVTWNVNSIPGGNGTVGTVSSGGLYTAPATVPSPATVSVTAVSVADPSKSATASVTIGGTIPATFFGLHMNHLATTPYPTMSFGAFRLWDDQTRWDQINTASGTYNFSTLDSRLQNEKSHGHNALIYTFGSVPSWASSDLTDSSCDWGNGTCDLPSDLAADGSGTNATYKAFVTALATHVHGLDRNTYANITIWDPWNEPHRNPVVQSGYAGSVSIRATYAQLVRMTEDLRCIITGSGSVNGVPCTATPIDTSAKIITPASTPQITENFLHCDDSPATGSQCTTGDRGSNAVDLNGRHFYESGGNAENLVSDVAAYKAPMHAADLAKPFYSAEGSWDQNTSYPDADLEASFVARYYILGASLNLAGMYWYAYDNGAVGTLWTSGGGLAKAGTAYQQVYNWLVGATVPSCTQSVTQWTCTFNLASGDAAEAIWDTSESCSGGSCTTHNVTVAPSWTNYLDLTGASFTISANTVPVGIKPKLLYSSTATLTVTVTPSGGGTVTSSPAGISCPGTCSASFAKGTHVSLSEATNSGYNFTGWSGLCSGSGSCSFTLSSSGSVTANFSALSAGCGGPFTLASPPPSTCIWFSGNSKSITTKQIPNAGSGGPPPSKWAANGDNIAKFFLTMSTDGPHAQTVGPSQFFDEFFYGSGSTGDQSLPLYYTSSADRQARWYKKSCSARNSFTVYFLAPDNACYGNVTAGTNHDDEIAIWDQTNHLIVGINGNANSDTHACLGGNNGGSHCSCGWNATASDHGKSCACVAYGNECSTENPDSDADWGYCCTTAPNWPSATGVGGEYGPLGLSAVAGFIPYKQWMDGQINHVMLGAGACNSPTNQRVFPATANDGATAHPCVTGTPNIANAPPLGAHFFCDYTDAQIAGMSVPTPVKTFLTACSHYGVMNAYTGTGVGGGNVGLEVMESPQAYNYTGTSNPIYSFLRSQFGVDCGGNCTIPMGKTNSGANSIPLEVTTGSTSTDTSGRLCGSGSGCDLSGHIHMLSQCVDIAAAGLSSFGGVAGCP